MIRISYENNSRAYTRAKMKTAKMVAGTIAPDSYLGENLPSGKYMEHSIGS